MESTLSSKEIRVQLFVLRDNGVGILVTTHVMDEAELTDKVGLLWKIIAFDTPQHLKESYQVSSIEEVFLKQKVSKMRTIAIAKSHQRITS